MMSLKSIVICLNCLIVKIEQNESVNLNDEILQDLKKYFNLALDQLKDKLSPRKFNSLKKKLFDFSNVKTIIENIDRLSKI